MDRKNLLTVTSLISLLLLTLHFTDDMVKGLDTPGPVNLIGIVIVVVFSIGPLLLRERLAGRILILLGALGAVGMPVLHMQGRGFTEIVRGNGGFFFFWTLLMLGVLGTLSFIMVVLESWNLGRARKAARGDGEETGTTLGRGEGETQRQETGDKETGA
jgi:hypothetical protein